MEHERRSDALNNDSAVMIHMNWMEIMWLLSYLPASFVLFRDFVCIDSFEWPLL